LQGNEQEEKEMKLIYHSPTIDQDTISPFDEAIRDVIKKEDIMVVCPYIDLQYFKKVIIDLALSWRLITNLKEVFKCQVDRDKMFELRDFINQHSSRIHNCTVVHAKVIISGKKAFLGSANLTMRGIKNNIEMSITLNQSQQIVELKKWFNDLWDYSKEIDTEEVVKEAQNCVSYLENHPDRETSPHSGLYNQNEFQRSKLAEIETKESAKDLTHYPPKLIEFLIYMDDIEWVNNYLDLLKEMFQYFNLNHNDQRLVTSIRKNPLRLPVTIGQRYVAALYYKFKSKKKYNDKYSIGLIMPLHYEPDNNNNDKIIYDSYFTSNKMKSARWIVFERKGRFQISTDLKNHWYKAISKELNRSKKSGYIKYHYSDIYRMVTDLSFRKAILDSVVEKKII
jgi:hypothetical protein